MVAESPSQGVAVVFRDWEGAVFSVVQAEHGRWELGRGSSSPYVARWGEYEEKHNNDRKKWMEEKVGLLNQAKEAEIHRNQEMRKFAADRERHLKQQTEIETLSAQLSVRDKDLQKWREERDQLVAALEVQLKNLVSSNIQKDEEIQQLKGNILRNTEMESTDMLKGPVSRCRDGTQDVPAAGDLETCSQSAVLPLGVSKAEELMSVKQAYEEPPNNGEMHAPGVPKSCGKPMIKKAADLSSHFSEASSIDDSEDHSDVALDSSALSTENGKTSRFPKPLLEIQFTPLTPNKMEVKHQGSASPVTIKINRNLRKRKSQEINESYMLSRCWKTRCKQKATSDAIRQGIVKTENNKNTTPRTANSPFSVTTTAAKIKKETINRRSSLKKQISTSSTLSARKKDGTLQKIGDLLHSSPAIFQNKAKKLMETISATKTAGDGSVIENQSKPKRSRRKLYTTDISAPMDIPSLPMIMDNHAKESDHLIMKRRLRAKTAK